MKSRLFYLIKIFLFLVFTLAVAKPVFMLCNRAHHVFTGNDMLSVVGHGLPVDFSTAVFLIIIPFVVVLLSVWAWHWNPLRRILKFYYVILALLLAFVFVTDTSLFRFTENKFNLSVFSSMAALKEAIPSISIWFILLRLLFIVIIATVLYFFMTWLTPTQKEHRRSIGFVSHSRRTASSRGIFTIAPIKKMGERLIATVILLLLVPLMGFGLRYSLHIQDGEGMQTAFSENTFLNQSAENPLLNIFSLSKQLVQTNKGITKRAVKSKKAISGKLSDYYNTLSLDTDTLLNTSRPNIVLIMVKGMGSIYTAANNNGHVTPNLSKLMEEGLYFTNCYANQEEAKGGMASIIYGCPTLASTSEDNMTEEHTGNSIASTLKNCGYETSFVYGGVSDTLHMNKYLSHSGYGQIISGKDIDKDRKNAFLNDWVVFDKLYEILTAKRASSTRPTFTTMLTLSSQKPWTVPMKRKFEDNMYNAFYFTDICLGTFVKRLKKTPSWENTLVVIVPDHSSEYKGIDHSNKMRNLIPMIWTGGALKRIMHVGMVCNQSDLAATLFGQLNISHEEFPFSRDIFSKSYKKQFAMSCWTDGFATYDASGFNAYDTKTNQEISGKNSEAINIGKTVLETIGKETKR